MDSKKMETVTHEIMRVLDHYDCEPAERMCILQHTIQCTVVEHIPLVHRTSTLKLMMDGLEEFATKGLGN